MVEWMEKTASWRAGRERERERAGGEGEDGGEGDIIIYYWRISISTGRERGRCQQGVRINSEELCGSIC